MADLLTVYDDGESNTFIDCTICDKRIRGDTNLKIHLTTLQHLKREKTLADKGVIPKPALLPQWDSIKDYLTYLNLNEPIIGLGDLVQEQDFVTNDGRTALRYRCRLCAVQMDLYEMTTHVVGRRHRQKYLERYRPDLVTWEKTSEKQAGVVARAKAAIVEKQEGWGNPVPLIRSDKGRSIRNRAHDGAARDRPSYPEGRASSERDRREEDCYNQSYMEGDAYGRPSDHREDNPYDQSYRDDVPHRSSGPGDNPYDQSYRDDVPHRSSGPGHNPYDQSYRDDVPHRSSGPGDNLYDKSYRDDVPLRSSGAGDNLYDKSYRDDVPHRSSGVGDNLYDKSYRDDVPHRSSGAGDNLYDKSYRDDVPHRSSVAGDNPYDQSYRDDVPHRSSGPGDNLYDAPYSQDSRPGSSYQKRDYMERPYLKDEINVGAFPSNEMTERRYIDKSAPQPYRDEWYSETNPSRGPYKSKESDDYYRGNISENRFGESGIDYQESVRLQEPMYTSHHGTGPSMDERQRQNRNLPFRETERERFEDVDETGRHGSFEMQGYNKRKRYYATEDDMPSKKKRKSRFSDASPLEVALAWKSQVDDMVLNYKPKGRTGSLKNQTTVNMDSGVTPRMENVLDVLNDIQIENVQEANFLKDKLCSLLKEFQSNKVQRTQGQVSQASPDFTDSYYSGNKMEQRRDLQESRRLDDQGFQETSRYSHDLQGPREYFHTRQIEEDLKSLRQNRGSEEPEHQWDPYREASAGRSEERLAPHHPDDRRGYREGAWNSRPLREEERIYAEQHRYQHDYRSSGDLYDPFEPSSSPPLESGSSTLDKLASTLLELVARKAN